MSTAGYGPGAYLFGGPGAMNAAIEQIIICDILAEMRLQPEHTDQVMNWVKSPTKCTCPLTIREENELRRKLRSSSIMLPGSNISCPAAK